MVQAKKYFLLIIVFLFIQIYPQDKTEDSYTIFGYVRGWHVTDVANNSGKFQVNMSRLGIKGKLNDQLSYGLLVDFSRLGKLSKETDIVNSTEVVTDVSATFSNFLLDGYAAFKPVSGLTLQLGQFKIPFSTENLLSASAIPFINRSLLMTYSTPGLRDIGFTVNYNNKTTIPVNFSAGLFNGSGQNKEEDDLTTNYVARCVVSPIKELNVSANYYGGRIKNIETSFWNIGAEYSNEGIWAAFEYGSRNNDLVSTDFSATSYFVYALYDFQIDSKLVPIIQPGFRFETADPNDSVDDNEISRYTIGLNFILTPQKQTHIRLNYEKYDLANGGTNPDKFIIEFQIRF